MRDGSDRYQVQTVPSALSGGPKRLGSYLVEAGLLTPAQIDVALNDQKVTGMRFGEVLAARGWVKQQTVEFIMKKVVVPERESLKPQPRQQLKTSPQAQTPNTAKQPRNQIHQPPITKPLPSIPPRDEGVNWVG